MKVEGNGNGIYKLITVSLLSILATGLFQYLITGRSTPTRDEMHEYVQHSSPYAIEKSRIDSALLEDETYWKQEHLYQIELDKRLREDERQLQEVRVRLKMTNEYGFRGSHKELFAARLRD